MKLLSETFYGHIIWEMDLANCNSSKIVKGVLDYDVYFGLHSDMVNPKQGCVVLPALHFRAMKFARKEFQKVKFKSTT